MNSAKLDTQITVEKKVVTQDPNFGTELVTWAPLSTTGAPPVAERFWAEVQDALPSRAEAVIQGLAVARNQTRCRLRWRDDIDSSMRVIVHRDSDVTYSIVGGPADIGGRKSMIEMVLEKYSA